MSDNLETAVNLAWTAGSNSTRFGIAAKYKLDSTASISVSMTLTKRVMLSTVYFTVSVNLCGVSAKEGNRSGSFVQITLTIQTVIIITAVFKFCNVECSKGSFRICQMCCSRELNVFIKIK